MDPRDRSPKSAPSLGAAERRGDGAARRVTSRELFGAAGVLVILHEGREYRLRITQNGKLILTA